jgi:hypothetical protein
VIFGPEKKITVFLDISSTDLDTLVPPIYKNFETRRIEEPSSRQRGCYIRIMTARVLLQKRISGREPQGATRQDEMIDSKPPVIK